MDGFNQDFIFRNSKIANERWEIIELQILQTLKNSLNIKANDLSQFKIMALKNKSTFLRSAHKLILRRQKDLSNSTLLYMYRTIEAGLRMTDRAVINVIQRRLSKTSVKKFMKIHKKVIASGAKANSKNIKLITSTILRQLSKNYSHIVQMIIDNVAKLKNNQLFRSGLREATMKSVGRVSREGLPVIYNKLGHKMDVVNYCEMATRANFKNTFNKMQNLRYNEYKIDLVISNYLADSSTICEPHQGNVHKRVADVKSSYPLKSTAEGEGHTTHINCRHFWMPYMKGVSLKPKKYSKSFIKKNRNNRNMQRYNERMIRKWRRENVITGSDYSKGKLRAWEHRQAKLISDNPGMSRDYSREKVLRIFRRGRMPQVL